MLGKGLAGTILDGRFQLTSEIGAGGFGVVYRGWDIQLNREVAIKILQKTASEEELQRFGREAQILARLSHPNIIKLYSFGSTAESTPYLVMEYLKGVSLRAYLNEKGKLSDFSFFKQLISQTCSGLGFAHAEGAIHRDISSSNIFLCERENTTEIKILDFGLSRSVLLEEGRTITETGMLIGNPLYMSPEQCRGEKIDARSDIYSLGCVMYESITGSPPFEADNAIGLLYQQQSSLPVEPQINFGNEFYNAKVNSIILKCLQKDPAKRFQSCAELRESLVSEVNTIELTNCKHWQKKDRQNLSADRSPKNAIALSLVAVLASASLFLLGDNIIGLTVSTINACDTDFLNDSKVSIAEFLAQNHQQKKARSILQTLSKKFEKQGKLFEAAKIQLLCLKLPTAMSDRAAYQKSLQELLRLSQKIPDSEAKATLLAKLRFANAIALSQIKEPDFTILEQAELLKQLSNSQYSTTTDCLAQFGFLLERITPAFESKPGSDKILVGQALLEYVMRIHKYTKSSRNSLDNFQILLENGGEYSLSKQIWEQRIKHASQNGEKDLVTLEVDSLRSLVKCDRPQAEELINKILHDKNSDFIAIARCWYLLADSAYKAGHYQDAKNYCDKALKTGPILTDNDEQFELLELKYLALYQLKDDARISELSKMLVDLLIAFIERNGPTVIIKSKGQAVSIREARANGEQSRCVIAIKLLSQAKQYAQLRRLLTAVQVQIESNDWPSFTKLFKKVMHETTPCEDSSCSALAKKILAEIASRETISSTNSRERNSSTKR